LADLKEASLAALNSTIGFADKIEFRWCLQVVDWHVIIEKHGPAVWQTRLLAPATMLASEQSNPWPMG